MSSLEGLGTDTVRFTHKRRRSRRREPAAADGVEVDAIARRGSSPDSPDLSACSTTGTPRADRPLSCFAADEVRVIVRPTRIYAKMLEDSFHRPPPRCADRERYSIAFGRHHLSPPSRRRFGRAQDLKNADIPLFRGPARATSDERRRTVMNFLAETADQRPPPRQPAVSATSTGSAGW
jgi:hypothetical protein